MKYRKLANTGLIVSEVALGTMQFGGCRGTSPKKAAKCRPFLNAFGSPMVATTAVAQIGPIPGILRKRWQVTLSVDASSIARL